MREREREGERENYPSTQNLLDRLKHREIAKSKTQICFPETCFDFIFIFLNIYLFLKERECTSGRRTERERETDYMKQLPC